MGIGYIKIELQTVLTVIAENSDALGPAIYPAAKPIVPPLHFKDCGGVRALGVNQNLLVERAFVVIAGSAQEACPAFIAAGDAPHGLVIQFRNKLKFGGQMDTSYLSGSVRFFA